jgi:arylsulfatase
LNFSRSGQDIAPTMLSAAGIPVPPHMQGRDIADLYLNPKWAQKTWRKDFFYEWTQGSPVDASNHNSMIPAVFALIQHDYKYFYWPEFKYEQIFNLVDDPFEQTDIFNTTVQSDLARYNEIKSRYKYLKELAQSGVAV